jgi:hypothetical protein
VLKSDLASGALGVRLALPENLEIIEETAKALVAQNAESGVRWMVRALPWRLDLNPANADVLEADVRADARASFDEFAKVFNEGRSPPQTRLESPLLECATVRAGRGFALRTVHRALYQPGAELVLGTLVAPTASGIVRFEIAARDSMTGVRESMLMATAVDVDAPPAFDDAQYDVQFPMHALSRVRAALSWVCPAIEVETARPQLTTDELELARASCVIRPPPRFLPLDSGTMGLSSGIETLARVAIATTPRLLDVWNVGPTPSHDPAKLERQARETIEQWANEGASDIVIETTRRTDTEPGVDCFVRFRAGGNPTQSVQRWFVRDGALVRVSSGGPPNALQRGRARGGLIETTPSSPPKAPWWKRW